MKRREIISALAVIGAIGAVLPLARAQQTARIPRIGLLSPFSASDSAPWHRAFLQGLRGLGWVEGKNIGIEYRFAEGKNDRLPRLAADLVRLKVDVIFVDTTSSAVAAQSATRAIPIVIASGGDTVASGLAESLARPGGNVTGLDQMSPELGGKRLALLKELVPKLPSVAVLWNPQSQASTLNWKELQRPARQLGTQLHSLEVRDPSGFDKAFEGAAKARAAALAIMPDPVFVTNLKRIADLAAKSHLPSIFHLREFADAGGLVTYGPDRSDMFRRAAAYVDKILKGATPGDMPIEQPTKFELVINLNTAKALGIAIPQSVLLRANELIK
jgi:putative ABC transport system substrate-binding protein